MLGTGDFYFLGQVLCFICLYGMNTYYSTLNLTAAYI